MDYITELQNIVSEWLHRMDNPNQPIPYKDALNECIYDLNLLIDKGIEEQLEHQQTIAEEECLNEKFA